MKTSTSRKKTLPIKFFLLLLSVCGFALEPMLISQLLKILSKNLEVISVNQATANGDLLKIQVNLKNLSAKEMNLNYKVEWMDEAGIVINDSSAVWMPLYVRGAENVAVQSVSTTPRAKNFWLKLQKAK